MAITNQKPIMDTLTKKRKGFKHNTKDSYQITTEESKRRKKKKPIKMTRKQLTSVSINN